MKEDQLTHFNLDGVSTEQFSANLWESRYYTAQRALDEIQKVLKHTELALLCDVDYDTTFYGEETDAN